MNEQKIMRAIEHFETTLAEVVFVSGDLLEVDTDARTAGELRAFEAILKLEGAEHLKHLVPYSETVLLVDPLYVRYQQHKDAVGILWDMTEKEINTHIWGWLFVLDESMEEEGTETKISTGAVIKTVKGTGIAKCLRKFMRDIKVVLEMGGQDG